MILLRIIDRLMGATDANVVSDLELGVVLAGGTSGTRKRGPKSGDNTKEAFAKLTEIARQNDGLLNDAIGRGLSDVRLVEILKRRGRLERLTFMSDIFATHLRPR
jgi:hypothetical protein